MLGSGRWAVTVAAAPAGGFRYILLELTGPRDATGSLSREQLYMPVIWGKQAHSDPVLAMVEGLDELKAYQQDSVGPAPPWRAETRSRRRPEQRFT